MHESKRITGSDSLFLDIVHKKIRQLKMLCIHHTDTDPHSYKGHDKAGTYASASDKRPVLKIGLST